MNKKYDTFIIGHVSLDEIIYQNETNRYYGGAVVYSSYAAQAGGHRVGLLTKSKEEDLEDCLKVFNVDTEDIYHRPSTETTSIRNQYLSEDKERRICTALSVADSFEIADIPPIESSIYHLAGLIVGDFKEELIPYLAQKGKVAVDVQGFLRRNNHGEMIFKDWENKKKYLPHIHFLKTDAAEAEIMTGETDRKRAAKILYGWGAQEIMITYNTEVIVYDGKGFSSAPFKPQNLTGRTGRGDTCFSTYITERRSKTPDEAVLYAAALTSLKMESPGPFSGTRSDVENYINKYYNAAEKSTY